MSKLKLTVIGVLAAVTGLIGYGLSQGDTINAASRECGSNSIIKCGSLTETELAADYKANKEKDLHKIFNSYGITSSMISNKAGKKGYVTKSGKVVVDGKTVATGAKSLGREYNRGGTKKVISGKTYYEGSTQVRFASKQLDAFVYFDKDGRFIAAILLVCGNPVRATPPAPKPKPVYTCDSLVADKISRNEYRFTTKATAKNGAEIVDYTYNFGDGTTQKGGATISHTYAKAGTYTTTVTVNVKVDGKAKTATGTKCKVSVTVEKENCPIPGKEHLPKDSPECKQDKPAVDIEKKVNGKEHDKVPVGTEFTYSIVVYNRGDIALKDLVVTDKAPAEVKLLAASEGTISGNTWTHTLGELAVGASKEYTITAKYMAYASGTHKNTVCVETPTVPGNPDDCDDATTETTEDVKVCDEDTGKIITVPKADEDKYAPVDSEKCQPKPPVKPPVTPEELPPTGIMDALSGIIGVGSLASASVYYAASRRNA